MKTKFIITLSILLQCFTIVNAEINIFSDNFNRAGVTQVNDMDAGSSGMSGISAPVGYVEREEALWTSNPSAAAGLSNIQNNTLHLADGANMSIVYLDHNFIDQEILTEGGMKIGMTIVSNDGTLTDNGRYVGFGIGSTSSEASTAVFDWNIGAASAFRGQGIAANGYTAGTSDLYVNWNTANGGYLEIYKNGPTIAGGENVNINGIALTGNDRLEMELAVGDFNSGSTVYANILWNSEVVYTTSFEWDYTNSNYIGITCRQNGGGFTIDDLQVTATDILVPAIVSNFSCSPAAVDKKKDSNPVTLSWDADGMRAGMTYSVTANKPVTFPNDNQTGTANNGLTSISANIDGTLGNTELTLRLFDNAEQVSSQKITVESIGYPKPDAPNVVVILLDDVGWSDIGCYGSEIQTPNIDMLANNGVRFRNFYQAARCSPTRISLITGLYTQQGAVAPEASLPALKDHGHAGANNVTIAEVLKEDGYRTYMAGKWHLGLTNLNRDPISRGFMHVFSCGVNADEALDGGPYGSWTESSYNLKSTNNEVAKRQYASNGLQFHTSDAIGDYGVDFIDHNINKNDGRPFFLYLPFIAAHWPINAPAELANKYTDIGDPHPEDDDVCLYEEGWDVIRQQKYARQLAMGVIDSRYELSPKGDHPDGPIPIPAWDTLDSTRQMDLARRVALYAAMIDQADTNIGKIVTKLANEGVLDNTLIFLCFDNGANYEGGLFGNTNVPSGIVWDPAHLDSMGQPENAENSGYPRVNLGGGWANASNTPFRLFKHFTHEGGIRTAGILYWPNGTAPGVAGTWTEQRGHLIDVMATVVDASGAAYPSQYAGHAVNPMEGTSLLPVLQEEQITTRDIAVEHESNRAFFRGDYKFVTKNFAFSDGSSAAHELELYNIAADPTEMHNIAGNEPEKLNEMIDAWNIWANRVGVSAERLVQNPITLPEPDYSDAMFQDLYERDDNYDIDGDTGGMTGSLSPISYIESFEGSGTDESIQIAGGELLMATGNGMSNMYLDHNFIDSEIISSGGFSVMLDVAEINTTFSELGERFGGFGVGLTAAEAASAEDVGWTYSLRPNADGSGATALSDFFIDIALDGKLRAWSGNTVLSSIGVNRFTGRIRVDFLLPDFNAGSNVIARIYFNEELKDIVSFSWDHSGQNYIGLSGRATNYVRMDNLVVVPFNSMPIDNADLTDDGMVDLFDFSRFSGQWLAGYGLPCPQADYTGDCKVDVNDLTAMSENWLSGVTAAR